MVFIRGAFLPTLSLRFDWAQKNPPRCSLGGFRGRSAVLSGQIHARAIVTTEAVFARLNRFRSAVVRMAAMTDLKG
jgi:hypothetical protein